MTSRVEATCSNKRMGKEYQERSPVAKQLDNLVSLPKYI
jgi:hypothetical protein